MNYISLLRGYNIWIQILIIIGFIEMISIIIGLIGTIIRRIIRSRIQKNFYDSLNGGKNNEKSGNN